VSRQPEQRPCPGRGRRIDQRCRGRPAPGSSRSWTTPAGARRSRSRYRAS